MEEKICIRLLHLSISWSQRSYFDFFTSRCHRCNSRYDQSIRSHCRCSERHFWWCLGILFLQLWVNLRCSILVVMVSRCCNGMVNSIWVERGRDGCISWLRGWSELPRLEVVVKSILKVESRSLFGASRLFREDRWCLRISRRVLELGIRISFKWALLRPYIIQIVYTSEVVRMQGG